MTDAFIEYGDAVAGSPELPVLSSRAQASEAAGYPPYPAASFTIPAPPSTNALFKNVPGKGRVRTTHYLDWQASALAALRMQRVKNVDGPCFVVLGVERHSLQADIDNTAKATFDLIVKGGVLSDDSLITGCALVWLPRANGLAHVQIFPCQRLTLAFHPSHDGASGAVVISAPFENGEE